MKVDSACKVKELYMRSISLDSFTCTHVKESNTPVYITALDCGDLHQGFARVKCNDCHHEYLLPFSCKKRNSGCMGEQWSGAE